MGGGEGWSGESAEAEDSELLRPISCGVNGANVWHAGDQSKLAEGRIQADGHRGGYRDGQKLSDRE